MITLYISVVTIIVFVVLALKKQKPTLENKAGFQIPSSDYRFTVYKADKNLPMKTSIIFQGNQVDDLGYQIYKNYSADLDKIDILIRRNETGEIMKIVKDGDSESMIGVSHPEHGHIGYLRFESIKSFQ